MALGSLRVLRNRNFALLLVGRLVSNFGDNLYALALPWYVYSITSSKFDLSLVGFADYLPYIAGFFVGALVDRWHKKRVMVTTDIVRMAIAFGIFTVVLFQGPFLVILLLVMAIQLVGSFFSPASGALTPLLVSSEELPPAMGLMQSSSGAVNLIATAAGGTFMAIIKASGLFLVDAVSFIGSVVTILSIRVREEVVSSSSRPGLIAEWKAGFTTLVRSRTILQIFLGGIVTNFGLSPMAIVLTAWIKGPMHGSTTLYGLLLGCLVLGTIVGGLFLGTVTKWLAPKSILRTGLIVLGVCTALIGFWSNEFWCGALLFAAGFWIAELNGALEVMLVKLVVHSMRGRLFGMFNGVMVFASPVGLAVFGALLIVLPMWVVWMAMGLLGIAGGLAYFIPVQDDLDQLSLPAS